ncbi:ABC transporter ATP-binding protein [Bacteroidaceae bacterium HV4-6-C5C]|jgi:iron complex transport system ATP-binding protein|nr:ABC transporter ATP-binding protein [Bacteroidaceae bacterium HV4-6-C5C]
MEKRNVISATDLSIGYHTNRGEKLVHQHLSFELHSGELTCLLGANGTGKSTLLRTLSSSQPALSGKLLIEGKPLEEYSERDRSRIIGIVLTDKTQAGGLTVYELVALGRQPHTGFFGRLHREDHRIIRQTLNAVGIAHKANNYIAELSDGERQKTMIAKALVQECPLILLDEPTAFLDVVSRIEIMSLLHRLAIEQNKAILLSTHDIEQALVLADKLWLLSKEKGLLHGVTEDLILQQRMDGLFSRKDIKFDYAHGVYYPEVDCQHSIIVEASDDVLLHWTINALNRHGFACLLKSQTEEVMDLFTSQSGLIKANSTDIKSPSTLPQLKAISAENLILIKDGVQEVCTSFEELLNVIEKYFQPLG